jgi:hypothetical protein
MRKATKKLALRGDTIRTLNTLDQVHGGVPTGSGGQTCVPTAPWNATCNSCQTACTCVQNGCNGTVTCDGCTLGTF